MLVRGIEMKRLLPILFLLLVTFRCPAPTFPNWFTTNDPAQIQAPAPGWLMGFSNNIPTWTRNGGFLTNVTVSPSQTNWPLSSITNANYLTNWATIDTNVLATAGRTNWSITDITNSAYLTNWALLPTNYVPLFAQTATNAVWATNVPGGGIIGGTVTVTTGAGSMRLQGVGVESIEWNDTFGIGGIGGLKFNGDTYFNNSSNHFNGDVETDGQFFGNGAGITNVTARFVSGTLTNNTTGNASTATKATYVADVSTNKLDWNNVTNQPTITSGTVTSVGISGPSGVTWANTPITGNGTFTGTTPGILVTNGESQAITVSNNWSVDYTHQFNGNGSGLTNSSGQAYGIGSVTSVALTAPGTGLTIGGSPVTGSGTLSLTSQGTILTNGESVATVFSNSVAVDAAHALSVSNLTASRMVLTSAADALSSAAASGAVPINADGSATTSAQVNTLFPGNVLTNGESQSTTFSNTVAIQGATIYGSSNQTNAVYVGPSGETLSNSLGNVNISSGVINSTDNVSGLSWSSAFASQLNGKYVEHWFYQGSATLGSWGGGVTFAGAAAVQVVATATTHPMLEYYTPAVRYNTNGVSDNGTFWPCSKNGQWTWQCQATNINMAECRMVVCLTSAATFSQADKFTNNTPHFVGFMGDATNSFGLGTTNWMFCTDDSNAAHWLFKDTGVNIQTLVTNFMLKIQGNGSSMTSAVGYLNGTPVATNTVTLPSSMMKSLIGIATESATVAAGFRVMGFHAEQDL